jgi:2-phosphoglycerate kinase
VRVVIDSHVVTDVPLVLEGDGILPALVDDPVLQPQVDAGVIRSCCVRADGVNELMENMVTRGRGLDVTNHKRHWANAAANDAFGAWLAEESNSRGIPVVASRPFATLVDRVLAAIDTAPISTS